MSRQSQCSCVKEYVRVQKNNLSMVSDDRQGCGCTAHTENDKYSNLTKCTHQSVSSDYLRVMGLEYSNSLFFVCQCGGGGEDQFGFEWDSDSLGWTCGLGCLHVTSGNYNSRSTIPPTRIFIFIFFNIYLFIWPPRVLVASCRIFVL